MNNCDEVQLLKAQLTTARSEINNLRQQLIALRQVHRKDCDRIQKALESWQCADCESNRLAAPATPAVHEEGAAVGSGVGEGVRVQYIGTISTQFPEKRGTPRQPTVCPDMSAKLTLSGVIFTNPEHALEGLQEFSHMWILFHFHKNDPMTRVHAKVTPPRLNGARTGVFATRSPHRPSPIGVSLVRIDRIAGGSIYFSGVDMVDGTPVIDIKPYIPQYDDPRTASALAESSAASNNSPDVSSEEARTMDGEENGDVAERAAVASSNHQTVRSASRIGEREAPDGEEEEEQQVRIPSWIDQPPVTELAVHYKQRALLQLQQVGPEGESKKTQISNVLRQDPRSVYLREHTNSSNYVFRIAELYVSCRFNDADRTVTVFQVFQDSVHSDE